jgi:AraC family transcriptional regulator
MPERQQPWPMISFCYAGAYIATTDDGECVVDRNTLLLLKGSQPYRTRPVSREPSFGTSISISPSIAREIAESDRDPIDNLSSSLDPRMRIAEAELFGWLGDPASSLPNLAIEERVLQLFASSMSSQRMIAGKAAEHTAAAKAVLAVSFRERVSLNQIALRVGISPFHLCRVFKSQTGLSLHQYVVRLRLFAALQYVANTRCNLSDLAHGLGFAQHSHLTTSFRRCFGVTPSEARRRLRNGKMKTSASLGLLMRQEREKQ